METPEPALVVFIPFVSFHRLYNKTMRLLKALCFIALFFLCGMGFRYLLIDDTESYTRLMMHEFYAQDQIDVLFTGSSHCYASLDPSVTDAGLGVNTFNAGSALQALDASFALIREGVERKQVRRVFLEMYYVMMANDEYKEREQMTGTYIVSDYMRPSLNKVRFLLEASSPEYYVNSFLPARRNWEGLLHPEEIRHLLMKKGTAAYRNFLPFDDYKGKGFASGQGRIGGGLLLDTAGFDRIHMESPSADWLRTLRDILDYCEKKGVELTLFSAPMTLFQTAGVGNYDEYIALIRSLTEGTDVRYWDFNLCREQWFDQTPDLFEDAGHLNAGGSERFSRVFADFFSGEIAPEELFYGSMAEKIAAHGADILGLSYLDSGDRMRKLKIVSAMPEGTRFTAVLVREDGSTETLLDREPELFFEIPQDVHGTVRIEAEGISAEIGV